MPSITPASRQCCGQWAISSIPQPVDRTERCEMSRFCHTILDLCKPLIYRIRKYVPKLAERMWWKILRFWGNSEKILSMSACPRIPQWSGNSSMEYHYHAPAELPPQSRWCCKQALVVALLPTSQLKRLWRTSVSTLPWVRTSCRLFLPPSYGSPSQMSIGIRMHLIKIAIAAKWVLIVLEGQYGAYCFGGTPGIQAQLPLL